MRVFPKLNATKSSQIVNTMNNSTSSANYFFSFPKSVVSIFRSFSSIKFYWRSVSNFKIKKEPSTLHKLTHFNSGWTEMLNNMTKFMIIVILILPFNYVFLALYNSKLEKTGLNALSNQVNQAFVLELLKCYTYLRIRQ